ncbi:MAG: glutathione synthase/RimK-type ligase-like ATP-grasp enzyme [Rhodothermales bacterium]|jgi:glutathione synthase/RimK-type ligase-like ATP-grasp enzyme
MAKKKKQLAPKTTRRIGILRGMETTFPDALIPYINETYGHLGIKADFVMLDSITTDSEREYDVVLDRISHEVPFYRSFLKWTAIKGTYVVNNPFWWSADDKFIDNIIAEEAKVAVPRSAILPHKVHPTNTQDASFRNLKYPINWDSLFEYVGWPAYLKPHDGGGWRGVTRCETPQDVFDAYDESGDDCMMLQEGIEFESYFRCYCVGQKEVRIMRYNPLAEPDQRYHDVPTEPIFPDLYKKIERDVLAICTVLGYDLNTVEFAVRGGVPYAIDFMNPAPDADYHAVGLENFEWIVKTMAEFLVKKARQTNRKRQWSGTIID